GAKQLEINYNQQTALGVNALLLDQAALKKRFPSLGVDDIVLGCLSPEDGTLTTAKALKGFRQKAESLGVEYVAAKVAAFKMGNNRVQAAVLDSGEEIHAEVFVNAAGAWANNIAQMAGLTLPIEPMCRVKHYWTCQNDIEPLPLIKDETALFFRPQGDGFVGGRPSWEIKPGFNFVDDGNRLDVYFDGYFERVVKPLLKTRLPAFESAVEHESWTGHYAQNTFDGNMILGQMGGSAQNLFNCCGFSGHGIMHAPAMGRALSELILYGRFETIDLGRMSYQRLLDNDPYPERGII
ncbi:MAG: NAD(P)/FAD-dependent oxidoreductase, partial [Anaerolineae bacterium]